MSCGFILGDKEAAQDTLPCLWTEQPDRHMLTHWFADLYTKELAANFVLYKVNIIMVTEIWILLSGD